MPLGLLLLAACLLTPTAGATDVAATSAAKCTYKWKKKRIVKYVKRHGKKKRIVRIRKYRVCVPVEPAPPARLGVKAYEYGFTLSRTSLAAGDTVVELSNRGEDEHNLHIQKVSGGTETVIPDTAPSTYDRARFTTQPGTYRLWCSLPTHAELGMDTTFVATGD
ncbi:MAG: hypothetical protein JJE13_11325 [Thermoleophilia bacterium]|nr:hypothetical protein [Thermoleophilia bacterium]